MYKDLTEAQQKKAIRYGFCGLFANRSTIQEAYDQAATQATSLKDGDKQKMIVCLQVLMNTWAIALTQMVPDPEELAAKMEELGYVSNVGLNGWTESYCEAINVLQDNIEGRTLDIFEKRSEKDVIQNGN